MRLQSASRRFVILLLLWYFSTFGTTFSSEFPVTSYFRFKCLVTTERLRPKSVGIVGIFFFIIKDCFTIFALLLNFVFDLSLCKEYFPTQ